MVVPEPHTNNHTLQIKKTSILLELVIQKALVKQVKVKDKVLLGQTGLVGISLGGWSPATADKPVSAHLGVDFQRGDGEVKILQAAVVQTDDLSEAIGKDRHAVWMVLEAKAHLMLGGL